MAKLKLVRDPTTFCGVKCDPFSPESCLLGQDSAYRDVDLASRELDDAKRLVIAQTLCQAVGDKLLLGIRLEEQSELVQFLQERNTQLSKDPNTGLLTGLAINALERDLYEVGKMDKYIEKGFMLRYICFDVDNLREHNAGPGKHDQGDIALAAVGRKVKELFSRGIDVTSMELLHEDVRDDDAHASGRSNEAGDEFNVYTFLAPNERNRSNDLEHATERIEEAFIDFGYEYLGVFYPVTVTFAIVDCHIPPTIEELRAVKKQTDVFMMDFKHGRDKSTTEGIGIDLTVEV